MKYTAMCLYVFVYAYLLLNNFVRNSKCKLDNDMNATEVCPWMLMNEEMLAGNADVDAGYPDADPDATYFEYRLFWYWYMYKIYVLVLYVKNVLTIWSLSDRTTYMLYIL